MPRPIRQRLTRKLIRELGERIRAGAYEHVAAESLGVPYSLLQEWHARGLELPPPKPIYRELADAIRAARAHARFMVEMEMRTAQPRYWLLHGPGKETATAPGWTAPVRAAPVTSAAHDDAERVADVCTKVLDALVGHPEIRAKVAAALGQQDCHTNGHVPRTNHGSHG